MGWTFDACCARAGARHRQFGFYCHSGQKTAGKAARSCALYRFRHGYFPAAGFAFGDELAGGSDSAAVHALGAFVFPA